LHRRLQGPRRLQRRRHRLVEAGCRAPARGDGSGELESRVTAEVRLADLGYRLLAALPPLGRYVRAVSTGNLVYTAGHGPFAADGTTAMRGQVGGELTLEQGQEAARLSVVACLSSLRGEIRDLERVTRIVKMLAFVNCAP